MTASLNPSTTKLLDLFISKQAELKALDTFVGELRKQIQTAIELGELESLDDGGRFQYENLQIQSSNAKPGSTALLSKPSRKENSSMETPLKPQTPRIDSLSRTPEPVCYEFPESVISKAEGITLADLLDTQLLSAG